MINNLLIDVDSTIPNLALMKLSTWLKSWNQNVYLNKAPVEIHRVWISVIFTWNRPRALAQAAIYKSMGIVVTLGGSGYSVTSRLGPEIEAMAPDYSLYNDQRIVGYCQRGCDRACPFCIVPKKEGSLESNEYAPLSKWVPPDHKKVILLDNNLTLSRHHDAVITDSINLGLWLNISQGYDIRATTKDKAALLGQAKLYDLSFRERRITIAWDFVQIEGPIRRGLPLLLDHFKPRHIWCYVLCGFNTTHDQDLYRFKVLTQEYGVFPYVMIYNNRKDDLWLNRFRRFVNQRFYRKEDWDQFNANEYRRPINESHFYPRPKVRDP